jgi:hypothetical protein
MGMSQEYGRRAGANAGWNVAAAGSCGLIYCMSPVI